MKIKYNIEYIDEYVHPRQTIAKPQKDIEYRIFGNGRPCKHTIDIKQIKDSNS